MILADTRTRPRAQLCNRFSGERVGYEPARFKEFIDFALARGSPASFGKQCWEQCVQNHLPFMLLAPFFANSRFEGGVVAGDQSTATCTHGGTEDSLAST